MILSRNNIIRLSHHIMIINTLTNKVYVLYVWIIIEIMWYLQKLYPLGNYLNLSDLL